MHPTTTPHSMASAQQPNSPPSPPRFHHQQPHCRCLVAGSDFCPRPRLYWTQELHDKFVEAVDELGGPNKATPIAIMNLMRVQGLTRHHLKSHLQKYRLGKTARRLLRRDFAPGDYDGVSSSTEAGASAVPPGVKVEICKV